MSDAIESPLFTLPAVLTPPLTHLGVIRATGVDAATFLQGQLTQDVLSMGQGQSRLGAFCSAKGRMLASFWVLKRQDDAGQPEFLLVCSSDILAQTLKRLSMFVLRAKVKMTDATGDFCIWGRIGPSLTQDAAGFDTITLANAHPYATAAALASVSDAQGGSKGPVGPTLRSLVLAPKIPGQTQAMPNIEALAIDTWQWLAVQSGVAMISLPTVDAFVPQMLNYESTGGVNFKKGCYPGQEVVARSQFRGTLKRRAFIVHSNTAMTPGDLLFSPLDAEQACGSVVQAAPSPFGGFDAVASMQVAAAQIGTLTWGSSAGGLLQIMALPYVLLDDV